MAIFMKRLEGILTYPKNLQTSFLRFFGPRIWTLNKQRSNMKF